MDSGECSVLASRYAGFLRGLARRELWAGESLPASLPADVEAELLWADGLLPGACAETLSHGRVQVLDHGSWNRSEGPDFLHAELEIGGSRICGDIEISRSATEWELAGHGSDARFNDVALHVVLTPPPPQWYTRSAQHRNIPVLYVPGEQWAPLCGHSCPLEGEEVAPAPLQGLPLGDLVELMQAAAARRVEHKRMLFRARAAVVGRAQAWYEALAVTLGYAANKQAMSLLARRAPLHALGDEAEAILFGTAGFLCPVLPDRVGREARTYHRAVWDAWWPLRGQYGLSESRRIPWCFSAGRPLNHPHRRVAALAIAALRWREIEPCLSVAGAQELKRVLASLNHPYWDWHCCLSSAPLQHETALIGASRIRDFLVNHVYVQDEAAGSWQAYLCLGAAEVPRHVARLARDLLGTREDVGELMKLCFAQQALLQLAHDCRVEGGYPAALASWGS